MNEKIEQLQQAECIFLVRVHKTVSKIDRLRNTDYHVISVYGIDETGEPADIRTRLASGKEAHEYVRKLLTNIAGDDIFDIGAGQ